MAHSNLSIAREIAYDTFVMVQTKNVRIKEALTEIAAKKQSKGKSLDLEFVKDIVFGSLRWYSKLFWILQNTAKRDLKETSPEIRAALICGTYQIFYMERVPDRVAVNESVEYVRQKGQASAVSFINGILRQISRRAEYFQKPDKETKSIEYLALQFAHPEWLVRRWMKQFKFDRMEGMLAFNNQRPPVTARCNSLKTELPEIKLLQQSLLKHERTHTEKRPLRSAFFIKDPPHVGKDSIFQQGFYTFQDEASQLLPLLVAAAPGEVIGHGYVGWGGKRLTHMAELTRGEATIHALSGTPEDQEKTTAELTRLGIEPKVTWSVGAANAWKPSSCDKILLCPPNSELGRLRRIPEHKMQFTESRLKKLADEQADMIDHALTFLKPGGELVYAVDSFEKEEVDMQWERLEKKFGDKIELVSPVPRLPDYYKKYVTRQNILVIYPGNQDQMDGLSAFIVKSNASSGGK